MSSAGNLILDYLAIQLRKAFLYIDAFTGDIVPLVSNTFPGLFIH